MADFSNTPMGQQLQGLVGPGQTQSPNATLAKFGGVTDVGQTPGQQLQNAPVPTDPKQFQQYLNQLGATEKGKNWKPIAVDGQIGPITLAAAKSLGVAVPQQLQQAQPAPAKNAPAQQQGQPANNVQNDANAALERSDPQAWLNQNMPDVAPYFNIPDLKNIIIQAAQQNWDPGKIRAAIEGTDWWRNTSASAKQFQSDQLSNPGQAQQQINNTKEIVDQAAKQEGIVLDDNDLTRFATQYLTQGWDGTVLQSELRKLPQYTGASDTQRAWAEKVIADPAEAAQERINKQSAITTLAQQLGVNLDPGVIQGIAENALKNNWDDQMIKNVLSGDMTMQNLTGASLSNESQLKQIAKDWGFTPGDNELMPVLQNMAKGTMSAQDYQAGLQQRAIQTYGFNQSLVDAMTRGVSPTQFYQPYAQVAQQELGIPADQQPWTDPKWSVAVNYNDPKTGITRPMNTLEWQQYIRSNDQYGWKNSQTAKDLTAGLNKTILSTFGDVSF